MNSWLRYALFIVIITLNLSVLMMRIMSDYTASNSAVDSPASILHPSEKNESVYQSHAKYIFSSRGISVEKPVPQKPIQRSGFDAILNCYNQSECIKPHIEISTDINVYFCKHTSRGGVRFYYLVRDGLRAHPKVQLLDFSMISHADYIFYLPNSAPWHKTECNDTSFASKLVVLDEFDLHQNFAPFVTKEERLKHYPVVDNAVLWNFLYFKRSYVKRKDGIFHGYPHLSKRDIYPLTYSIAEAYIQSPFNQNRDIDILCTLRGSKKQSTRLRVQQSVQKYIDAHPVDLSNSVAKQLDGSSRKKVSHEYFKRMHRAKVVVTVNPANWEGDFRLWEALSSGALVFVDPIMVPHPYPLIDGRHVIYFSQNNDSDLHSKLDYYRTHVEEARRIAMTGYLHVMTFHRTINMVDYVLRTAEVKKAAVMKDDRQIPSYTFTGQSLVAQTKLQEKNIKKTRLPGKYS